MEFKSTKIQSFTDLYAWQEGHKSVIMLYTVTKNFPKEEMFGLVSQMRRSAVSVTSNIAFIALPRDRSQKYKVSYLLQEM